MNKVVQLKHRIEEYGVVEVCIPFFNLIFSSNKTTVTSATHGIRKIKVIDFLSSEPEDKIIFLIWSKDVPAYVAFHRIMDDLDHIMYREWKLPKLVLEFQDVNLENG